MENSTRNRKLTRRDKESAAKLKKLWLEHQEKTGCTQVQAARKLGMNQSAVSQYLNGTIALGTIATAKWAALLGVKPREIRADFGLENLEFSDLDGEAVELAALYASLPKSDREALKRIIEAFAKPSSED